MDNQDNSPIMALSYRKSNDFITAKYKASLLENKVMGIALSRIEQEDNKNLVAYLYPGELKQLVSDEAHIYRDLKVLAKRMTGHTMFLEDGKGNFQALAVIPSAEYRDGTFKVTFNPQLGDHILNLTGNYTTIDLSVISELKSDASYRLYELFKKEAYHLTKENPVCYVEYRLSELKFMIGIANADHESVKRNMSTMTKGQIDWDYLYEKLPPDARGHDRWADFKRRILDPAKEELQNKGNICFDYTAIREGHKVARIRFAIRINTPLNMEAVARKAAILESSEYIGTGIRQMEMPFDTFPDFFERYIDHNGLTKEDLSYFINLSGLSVERVEQAIQAADEQPHLKNYRGWKRTYIEKGFSPAIETVYGSAKKASEANEAIDEASKPETRMKSRDRMWEKAKSSEHFNEFLDEGGYTDIDEFEALVDKESQIKMWVAYKKDHQFID